ncbi:hypothetical protein ACVXG7_20950 [Enterobacter hormaechei]
MRDSYQLHAAVVEVIIHKDAEVSTRRYRTGSRPTVTPAGTPNFVTKRALCEGENSKMS